jgi:ribonuclease HIII
MPNFKTKLAPAARSAAEQTLKDLAVSYRWQPLSEQYCQYRLDGKTALGWVRVKQYSNGTFYLDAESATDLHQLLQALGFQSDMPAMAAPTHVFLTYPYSGSDESGKGDYFGPLVVAAVNLLSEDIANHLKQLGIADSKTLTDDRIARLLPDMVALLGKPNVYLACLMPASYNQHYVDTGSNLNTLMAKTHAYAHGQLLQYAPVKPVAMVIDNFGGEKKIQQHCQPLGLPLTLATQAESRYVAVAAASCLARHTFVDRIGQLSEQWDIRLPLGAGPAVKAAKAQFLRKHGIEALPQVAKTHFKV